MLSEKYFQVRRMVSQGTKIRRARLTHYFWCVRRTPRREITFLSADLYENSSVGRASVQWGGRPRPPNAMAARDGRPTNLSHVGCAPRTVKWRAVPALQLISLVSRFLLGNENGWRSSASPGGAPCAPYKYYVLIMVRGTHPTIIPAAPRTS